jgi:hypothetical protein
MLSTSIRSTGGWRPALSAQGAGAGAGSGSVHGSHAGSAHGMGYGYGYYAHSYGAPGADEGASVRALRRRGSAGSVDSFESRWSWMGAGAGVHTPGAGASAGPGGAVGVVGTAVPGV